MSRIVVIGSGFGGLATALRLAKNGHQVTLTEAADELGGALRPIHHGDFTWNTVHSMLLPAVTRDLFRKSGRAIERELDLEQLTPAREHRFEDGRRLIMTSGSRADQRAAVADALGSVAATEWTTYVDQFAPVWENLRRDLYERPWAPEHASSETRQLLKARLSLHRLVSGHLKDKRLHGLALHAVHMDGHNPRDVPAWMGMWSYVEENFGTWQPVGGMAALLEVMVNRLDTRKVATMMGTAVTDLQVHGGRLVGVSTNQGRIDADIAVVAIDPRRLPSLADHVRKTTPAIPPVITHLGLLGDVPPLEHEVVIHGDPSIVIRPERTTVPDRAAWTVMARGHIAEDLVNVLHRHGLKVRKNIEVRVDRSPRALVEEWHGSPLGTVWQGRATFGQRLGPRTPIEGVYLAGSHAKLGSGIPAVGLSANSVAALIGAMVE